MDLGGKEREREEEGWLAREVCGVLCVCGGAQRERERTDYISFNSFLSPTGPSLHPGSLAAALHLGPDHLLPRQPFQLRLFPFTDATPLSPKSPAFSPPTHHPVLPPTIETRAEDALFDDLSFPTNLLIP